jgi:hypothetical protein
LVGYDTAKVASVAHPSQRLHSQISFSLVSSNVLASRNAFLHVLVHFLIPPSTLPPLSQSTLCAGTFYTIRLRQRLITNNRHHHHDDDRRCRPRRDVSQSRSFTLPLPIRHDQARPYRCTPVRHRHHRALEFVAAATNWLNTARGAY